ncbi:hypothetical protein T4D_1432 [Trichinella pseudospiralis]|uniref:Uncharacterized protein n=1 Tax=Trichinella pseudospiralis TaxID=6337 RepID=A0A0V1DML2_TRIPS|nr:hypothetical protein T4D_1432 [Trichinella pseudospiralis]
MLSLYLKNYLGSIDTHYAHFCENHIFSKISKFLNYRLACLAKNGKKFSFSENNPVVVE